MHQSEREYEFTSKFIAINKCMGRDLNMSLVIKLTFTLVDRQKIASYSFDIPQKQHDLYQLEIA